MNFQWIIMRELQPKVRIPFGTNFFILHIFILQSNLHIILIYILIRSDLKHNKAEFY